MVETNGACDDDDDDCPDAKLMILTFGYPACIVEKPESIRKDNACDKYRSIWFKLGITADRVVWYQTRVELWY